MSSSRKVEALHGVVAWLPLVFALVATILFSVWTYFLATQVVTINLLSQSRFQHFLAGEPNAMGDALAGFVGSLTLIWVVASVFQQSMELRAQRREFSEMVVAQRAQVSALDAQRKIFEDEQEQRKQDEISKILDRLLFDLARACELANIVTQWEFSKHEDDFSGMIDDRGNLLREQHVDTIKPFSLSNYNDVDERVYQHGYALMAAYIFLQSGQIGQCIKKAKRVFFEPILDKIDDILRYESTSSKAQRVRIASLNLESMKGHLNSIFDFDLWEDSTSVDVRVD